VTPQEIRQALADAASSVEGINCRPNFVQSTRPGDAMVRLDHIDYPNAFGGIRTWQVAVILPQDYAAAEKFLDEKTPDLIAALGPHMQITRVTPAQLALDTATVPVVFIEGAREED
jgi:hypothetical protein